MNCNAIKERYAQRGITVEECEDYPSMGVFFLRVSAPHPLWSTHQDGEMVLTYHEAEYLPVDPQLALNAGVEISEWLKAQGWDIALLESRAPQIELDIDIDTGFPWLSLDKEGRTNGPMLFYDEKQETPVSFLEAKKALLADDA